MCDVTGVGTCVLRLLRPGQELVVANDPPFRPSIRSVFSARRETMEGRYLTQQRIGRRRQGCGMGYSRRAVSRWAKRHSMVIWVVHIYFI